MAMGTDDYTDLISISDGRAREIRDHYQSQMSALRGLRGISEKVRAEEARQRAQEKAAAERETKLLLLLL